MSVRLEASMTNLARRYTAEAIRSSFHFIVTDYVLGDQGHDVENPMLTRTVDRTMEAPNDGRPLLWGPDTLDTRQVTATFCSTFGFTLSGAEAVGQFSQIGLLATVTASPGGDLPAVGTQFLYAVANRPLTSKVPGEVVTYTLTIRR